LAPDAQRLLELVLHLSATSRALRRRLAALAARVDLTEHELLAIWLCASAGRAQGELAATLGISPAQMSGLVERLRARGLVEREWLTHDRRRHVWRTSAGGREVLASAVPPLQELARELVRWLREEEQSSLAALCRRLASADRPGLAGLADAASPVFLPCLPPHAA
jgi:DNA-binding MarR family transcriptional regulator